MIDYYKPKYFGVAELVPESVYEARGEMGIELIDVRVLVTLDQLRESYGPTYVNTWALGETTQRRFGLREWSGLRTEDSPVGSPYSQHRFGRAMDCIFAKVNADIVREDILASPDRFPFINAIELGTSWLHFDVRNCERIKTFRP